MTTPGPPYDYPGLHYDYPGAHYDADATMAVPEPHWNTFYILFPVKGIMGSTQIISSRLYVRLKGTWSLASRALLNTGE